MVLRHTPSGSLIDDKARSLSGIEWLRAMREHTLPDPPIFRMTGMHATDVGLGQTTMAMPPSPWWQTGAGVFMAGTLAFLADGPLGAAVLTAAPQGVGMSTTELSIDFLRPATVRSAMLIGRGRLIHSTRSQGLSEVFIDDGRGRVLAHGTSRCNFFPIDPTQSPQDLGLDPDGVHLHRLEVEGSPWGQEFWNATPGIEIARQFVEGELTAPPLPIFTGLRPTAFGEGTATVTMPASAWFSNAFGSVFGGAISLLLDFTANMACMTTVPAATAFAPLDLKVNFLRPVFPDGSDLTATATVTHRGRNVAVVSSELTAANGKRVAVANETTLILPGRPWDRPVYVVDEAPI